MKYKCRPGVVLEQICGVRLLIPTLAAFEACPNVIRLSLPAAMCWELISKDRPFEDIYRMFSILTKKPDPEVHCMVQHLLDSLVEAGALIASENEI